MFMEKSMPGKIIDGEAIAREMLDNLKSDVGRCIAAGHPPHLRAIRANADPGSAWYAKAQARHCQAEGIVHSLADLGPDAGTSEILSAIREANDDPTVSAILLFMPLPPGVDQSELVQAIAPGKDAEGVHPLNLGKLLVAGESDPAPCTAMAAVRLVLDARPDLSGARALVIGRSAITGKPAALLLLARHATVTIAHTKSDLPAAMREADIIIAAAGASGARWRAYERTLAKHPGTPPPDLTPLVKADMIRPGAIVIDVGENQIPKELGPDGKPVLDAKGRPAMIYAGDVDFEAVKETAGHITNPRGGVGPVTNAYLIQNTVRAACRHLKLGEKNG